MKKITFSLIIVIALKYDGARNKKNTKNKMVLKNCKETLVSPQLKCFLFPALKGKGKIIATIFFASN
jgi:hypothetical protein